MQLRHKNFKTEKILIKIFQTKKYRSNVKTSKEITFTTLLLLDKFVLLFMQKAGTPAPLELLLDPLNGMKHAKLLSMC